MEAKIWIFHTWSRHGAYARASRLMKHAKKKQSELNIDIYGKHSNFNQTKYTSSLNLAPNKLIHLIKIICELIRTCIKIGGRHKKTYIAFDEISCLVAIFGKLLFGGRLVFLSRGDIIQIHILDIRKKNHISWILRYWMKLAAQYCCLSVSDILILQAEGHKEILRRRFGYKKVDKKVRIIQNDIPTTKPISKKGKDNNILGNWNYVFMQYFSRGVKGADLIPQLSEWIRQIDKNASIDIYGKGPYKKELIKYSLNLPQVNVHEWHNEPIKVMQQERTILIIPSRYDTCPNLVLEAMGVNCRMAATNIWAHRELLGGEVNLFDSKSKKSFWECLDYAKSEKYIQDTERRVVDLEKKFSELSWEETVLEAMV